MSTSTAAGSALGSDDFRDIIGRFASGVTVITTEWEDRRFGATASATSSLSLEPPMLLVCLNASSSTAAAVTASQHFVVNILDELQGDLARHFAGHQPDKFAGVASRPGRRGAPRLDGALAHLECRVVEQVIGGTHTVFLAEVDEASAHGGRPLAYFRGQFGEIRLAHDERAHAALREAVLDRSLPIGQPLDVGALATSLSVPERSIQVALARLVDEGLIDRGPDGVAIVAPLTFDRVHDAYQARLTVHLGAAVLGVGHLSHEDLARLRQLGEAARPLRPDGRRLTPEEFFDANGRFLEFMLAASGSEMLIAANRGFSLPGLMTRSLVADEIVTDDMADDHLGIVEAYESGDLDAAVAAIHRIHRSAIAQAQARMSAADGRI